MAYSELQLKRILLAQVRNVDVLNTLALQDYVKMYARTVLAKLALVKFA